MTPIPLPVQTLYAELLQRAGSIPARRGSIYRRTLKGIAYTYLKQQRGRKREDVFIGRGDDPDTIAEEIRITQANEQAADNRKLVQLLRSAGLPVPQPFLAIVLEALGEAGILEQVVLVGTGAYQCYSPIVGFQLPSAALTTQDADIATATLAVSARDPSDTLETILKRADPSFTAVMGLDPRRPPASFRAANGFAVDVLTPLYRRSDRSPMPLRHLAAGAIPLQQLDWLIESPIEAVALHGSGIQLRVPQPARYAMHKLIVAQKRGVDVIKRSKDLLQGHSIIEALQTSDPWALNDAYENASSKGDKGWRHPIKRSLVELGFKAGKLEVDAQTR